MNQYSCFANGLDTYRAPLVKSKAQSGRTPQLNTNGYGFLLSFHFEFKIQKPCPASTGPLVVLHTRMGFLPRNSSTISASSYHYFCLSLFHDSLTRCLVAGKTLENNKVFESSRRFDRMDYCSVFAPYDFLTIRMLLDACRAHIILLQFKF